MGTFTYRLPKTLPFPLSSGGPSGAGEGLRGCCYLGDRVQQLLVGLDLGLGGLVSPQVPQLVSQAPRGNRLHQLQGPLLDPVLGLSRTRGMKPIVSTALPPTGHGSRASWRSWGPLAPGPWASTQASLRPMVSIQVGPMHIRTQN